MPRSYIFELSTLVPKRGKMNKHFAAWFEHFATHNACYWILDLPGSDGMAIAAKKLTPSIYGLAIASSDDVYSFINLDVGEVHYFGENQPTESKIGMVHDVKGWVDTWDTLREITEMSCQRG